VITVDEMVGLLNHKGQKQTYRSICQISKDTDLTKFSIIQIIHCILAKTVFRLPTRLLSTIDSFSCIYISQGSVATQLMCGGIFSNHFIVNCLRKVNRESAGIFVRVLHFWHYTVSPKKRSTM